MTQVEQHMQICDELNALYAKKNQDYGDSFHRSFEKYGMVMPLIRLGDKMNRLESLALSGEQQVKDESMADTLNDIANYAIMTRMELEAMQDGGF